MWGLPTAGLLVWEVPLRADDGERAHAATNDADAFLHTSEARDDTDEERRTTRIQRI